MMTKTLCVAFLSVATAAQAAVTVIADNQVGPGGAGSTFIPGFAVSSTDLLNGLSPTTATGNFTVENSGGIPILTNGTFGAIQEPNGTQHPVLATAGTGGGAGTELIYTLNTASAPLGYNLSRIDVYGGWNDSGRDQQLFTIAYSTVATPATFITLANVNFNPSIPANVQSATRAAITESAGQPLAANVGALRFSFAPPNGPSGVESGYSGYAEIDVFGTPVPEPRAVALLFAGLALLFGGRRSIRGKSQKT